MSKKILLCLLAIAAAWIVVPQVVALEESFEVQTRMLALPGSLDKVQVLNSNSPEVVQSEGILVSTFSPAGKATPEAHLNQPLQGQFDIFAHHIAKSEVSAEQKTLYLAIIVQNAGKSATTLKSLEGASYLSQPDAPFVPLPSLEDNAEGTVFAGPGDRVMNEVLRHRLQNVFPQSLELIPGQPQILAILPIPVTGLTPPLNGRSLLLRLSSAEPVYVATLAAFGHKSAEGSELPPTNAELLTILQSGALAGPREKSPSRPGANGPVIYGRVGGVQEGSTWTATLADESGSGDSLSIPGIGKSISYPLSSVLRGSFGTQQIQAAPIIKREPDTAYSAHGNYGVKYDITIPLVNNLKCDALVLTKLQTPLKSDDKAATISFNRSTSPRVFFRGTVKTSFTDSQQMRHEKFTHLVQHQGESGLPLVAQYLKPREKRTVKLEFLYPPDATPPQVLTIESTDPNVIVE